VSARRCPRCGEPEQWEPDVFDGYGCDCDALDLPTLDYEATDYAGLCQEISDMFMGETGDLIRDHARAVILLRRFLPDEAERVSS
jgi:hypothetical protein